MSLPSFSTRVSAGVPLAMVLATLLLVCMQARGQFAWKFPVRTALNGYCPTVLYSEEEQLYKMWYAVIRGGYWDINYAVSFDGVRWLEYPAGAVLTHGAPGEFDSQWAIDPFVLRDHGQYVMYYTGHNDTKWQTGMATSKDGIHWAKYSGNPIVPVGETWDNTSAGPRVVMKMSDSTYLMLFNAFDGSVYRVGAAVSEDGVNWRKRSSPKLGPGAPGTWDQDGVAVSSVVFTRGTYYMFYQAAAYDTPLGLAISQDALSWTRVGTKPVLTAAMTSWAPRLGFGSALLRRDTVQYWFSGERGSWSIGYLTAPWPDSAAFADTTTGRTTGVHGGMPVGEFHLDAAYPNPFNPSTMISYTLPERTSVRVTLYSSIGQEVATVVDETQGPGRHSVQWDARGAASGVYLCRVVVGSRVQTQRLALVK